MKVMTFKKEILIHAKMDAKVASSKTAKNVTMIMRLHILDLDIVITHKFI